VWIFALINYWPYNTSDAILSGAAINALIPAVPSEIGFIVAAVVATVVAVFGYSQIHWINKVLLWPTLIVLAMLTVAVFMRGSMPEGAFDLTNFQLAPFMTVFVIIAGFQLGWAPYVSDYSRYLPANVGVRATFLWTFFPSALSGIWVFGLGALASGPDGSFDAITAFRALGDAIFPGFGLVAVALLLIGLLAVMCINAYGGSLAMISIIDSFKKVKATKTLRVITLIIMGVAVWFTAAVVGVDNFNGFYGNALVFLAYLFTPWTAINLVDYFWVRRGTYVIMDLFRPSGIYGRWGWRGNLAYVITLAIMVPFFVTGPFTGFIATALGGVDYSLFIGVPVAGLLYLWFARGIDLKKEKELAAAEGDLSTQH
jgi:NCS1 family nucleobase:cation symporter-1